jgi:hypothetical protein
VDKKAVLSFAELCGVSDASFIPMSSKDWGGVLGRSFITNQERMATSLAKTGQFVFYPSRNHFWLTNIRGTTTSHLKLIFEPVGVTKQSNKEQGGVTKSCSNVTMARLDLQFGTSKAIKKDDGDSSGDSAGDSSDEELYYKYEKDQPAGAILKFVVNKYLEVYGTDNGRVA